MTADDLVAAYRRNAIAHGEAMEAYDARTCNRAYDALARIRRRLREAGRGHEVLALLDDDHRAVRLAAAVDALDLAPADGVRVLRQIARGPAGEISSDAAMVLEQWETGQW